MKLLVGLMEKNFRHILRRFYIIHFVVTFQATILLHQLSADICAFSDGQGGSCQLFLSEELYLAIAAV